MTVATGGGSRAAPRADRASAPCLPAIRGAIAGLAACALASGCYDDRPEARFGPISAAWLEDVRMHEGALLFGLMGGTADLRLENGALDEVRVPVRLFGGTLGLGIEVAPAGAVGPAALFDLPDGDVYSDDLFGWYRGNAQGIAVAAGVETHHLRNSRDVRVHFATVPFGGELNVGVEWLKVEFDDDYELFTFDVRDSADTGVR